MAITKYGRVSFKYEDGSHFWCRVREHDSECDRLVEYYHTQLSRWVEADRNVVKRVKWEKDGTNRKNITQPTALWGAVIEQMDRDGATNLSAWVGECMEANLDADLREGLPERPKVGNPNFRKREGT